MDFFNILSWIIIISPQFTIQLQIRFNSCWSKRHASISYSLYSCAFFKFIKSILLRISSDIRISSFPQTTIFFWFGILWFRSLSFSTPIIHCLFFALSNALPYLLDLFQSLLFALSVQKWVKILLSLFFFSSQSRIFCWCIGS